MMFLSLILFFVVPSIMAASVLECEVVPMIQWGGSPSSRVTPLNLPVGIVVVQHTVTKECYTDADCEEIAKGIRKYQMDIGFEDIAQSFLIGGNGKIYEGAGWLVGAHTRGYNNRSISISFIGDFREKAPTPRSLEVAQDFLNCSVYKNNLNMNYHLVGHKQLSATLSPGASLQKIIETWPHWLSDTSGL